MSWLLTFWNVPGSGNTLCLLSLLYLLLTSPFQLLLTKVHIGKAVVFPVVMYRCESWTIKEAEHQRIDALEMWCWRRLLRVPWTARRSNQSILKEINPEYSFEGLILKFQYFGHLMRRADSLEKTLMLGKIEGRRRRGRQRMRGWMASPTQWTWVWVNSGSWRWTGRPGVLQSMGLQNSRTRLSDWTTTKCSTVCLRSCWISYILFPITQTIPARTLWSKQQKCKIQQNHHFSL